VTAHTRLKLQRALSVAPIREKITITVIASGGIRDGGLPTVHKRNLEPIEIYQIYKVTGYKNTNSEYITFCSHEARRFIDEYYAFREMCCKKVTDDSPLFRNVFDPNDFVRASRPKPVKEQALAGAVGKVMVRGVRKPVKVVEGQSAGSIRYPVKVLYGLRKFFETQATMSGIDSVWGKCSWGTI